MSASFGYKDTPILPDSGFHVHDGDRPQAPSRGSRRAGAQSHEGRPPNDAKILFDGTDLAQWKGRDGEAKWKVEHGHMEVVPGTGDITTVATFGDIHLIWNGPRRRL